MSDFLRQNLRFLDASLVALQPFVDASVTLFLRFHSLSGERSLVGDSTLAIPEPWTTYEQSGRVHASNVLVEDVSAMDLRAEMALSSAQCVHAFAVGVCAMDSRAEIVQVSAQAVHASNVLAGGVSAMDGRAEIVQASVQCVHALNALALGFRAGASRASNVSELSCDDHVDVYAMYDAFSLIPFPLPSFAWLQFSSHSPPFLDEKQVSSVSVLFQLAAWYRLGSLLSRPHQPNWPSRCEAIRQRIRFPFRFSLLPI